MLLDSTEIEIVKNARESGIRNPMRSRIHFERIINRFFASYDFSNKAVLDIGPGHYDFCELARNKGAIPFAIELDDAVIELGKYKKIEVVKGNLSDVNVFEEFKGKIDLLFCRGSINCCWFSNEKEQQNYIQSMLKVLKPNGSAWISPCNEPINSDANKDSLKAQLQTFKENGFYTLKSHKLQAYWYGIWSDNPKLIYTKNLRYHKLPW
ncbi:MAG: class I SAM-dependent methyltransferase [Chitinophagaceae bacterium]